ncbi:MAG: MarR family transcriptional regulator [Bryobacter sp.]|nr:MarR family transcriptional regulator [Bryobacter sp. CoA8 C33]
MPSAYALHLIERLSALLRSEVRRTAALEGLEPVHVVALWYLSRSNSFSDNPLAVGAFLGLTKGNMSQRLNVLEAKGFLAKGVDKEDRRRVHLSLTPSGKAALGRLYPPASWINGASPELEQGLENALQSIIAAHGGKSFGICRTCRFHDSRASGGFCQLLQIPLSAKQAGQICQEHQAREVHPS